MAVLDLFGPPKVERMTVKGDVKGLIKALGYREDSVVRWHAAGALGAIGDARAVEPLIDALRDSGWEVRSAAVKALVEIGAPAVRPLIVALKEGREDVRWRVAEALGAIGDVRAVEPLIAALAGDDRHVRWRAAGALGAIGDVCAVESLSAALGDRDSDVREAVAGALNMLERRADHKESCRHIGSSRED